MGKLNTLLRECCQAFYALLRVQILRCLPNTLKLAAANLAKAVQADTVSAAYLADQAAKSKSVTGSSVVERRSGEGSKGLSHED